MLAMRGLLAGGVLLLVLGSNPVLGESVTIPSPTQSTNTPTHTLTHQSYHMSTLLDKDAYTNTHTPSHTGLNIAAIVAPTVVLGLLAVALVVLFWLLCVVKKKRQTEGTYRPSAEEQSGSRGVEMPDALKLPKEERLI
ncbi:unnamed protein product [Lota lota]